VHDTSYCAQSHMYTPTPNHTHTHTHTCSKFHTIDPQISHANVQNLVIQVTWQPHFVLLYLL